MKKVLVILLSLVMIFTMSYNVLAAGGGFVSSPKADLAPDLLNFYYESYACKAALTVTSYNKRATLDSESRAEIEKAYDTILAVSNASELNKNLHAFAKVVKIPASRLAVSDLFDLKLSNCDLEVHKKEEHGEFFITMRSESLKSFVALIHFTEGEWKIIPSAYVIDDMMTFRYNGESPVAVVVDTEYDPANAIYSASTRVYVSMLWRMLDAQ